MTYLTMRLLSMAGTIALVSAILPIYPALSATVDELKRYDFDNSGRLFDDAFGREFEIYTLHNQKNAANAALRTYDVNNNGRLEDEELAKLYADADANRLKPKALVRIGALQDEAERRQGIPLDDLASKKKSQSPNPCDPQEGLYVRRDQLDISVYNASLSKSSAKGASVSYARDNLTDRSTATINGVASYVVARSPCRERPGNTAINEAFVSGYAVAPWVSAQGNISSTQQEKSALKIGMDAQFEVFSGTVFDLQYVTLSPYAQTDFRFGAEAYGARATWEPFKLDWRLGGSYQQFSSLVDYFWQLQLEADVLTVNRAGKTSLKANQEYANLGGTVRLNAFLLPDQFDDRLYAVGEANLFWDAVSDRLIDKYIAELGFNITEDKSTSISVNYTYGRDKSTLKKQDGWTVNLNYKL